jgi:hypothetical protein
METIRETVQLVKTDYKVSWKVFKENFRPFFAAEVFILAITLIISVLFYLLQFDILNDPTHNSNRSLLVHAIFVGAFLLPSIPSLFYNTFSCMHYGLSYDIMSSGNMCTEFKMSFQYFKSLWWRYTILLLVLMGLDLLISPYYMFFSFDLVFTSDDLFTIIKTILYFVSFVLIVESFPSVTANHNFKHIFSDLKYIISSCPKRLFLCWGVFLIIMSLPQNILAIVLYFTPDDPSISSIFTLVLPIFMNILRFPFIALISTRIYNSVKYKYIVVMDKQLNVKLD